MLNLERDPFGRFLPVCPDPFDPRFLFRFDEPKHITLDRMGDYFCTVSPEDYDDVRDMGWQLHPDGKGKLYVRGNVTVHGERSRPYMHRVIADRFLPPPPTPLHFIVDHKDSDGLHNHRPNLRRVTPSQNAMNRHGFYWRQLSLWNQ